MNEFITPKGNVQNKKKWYESIIECEEFFLIKENSVYKIIIANRKSEILIKCKNYEIHLNNNDFSILMKTKFNSLNELYIFIINRFEQSNVIIKDIIINQYIKLILKTIIDNKEHNIEIILSYNKNNLINNEMFVDLKNDLNYLKEEINLLKNKINNNKNNNSNILEKSNEFIRNSSFQDESSPMNILFYKILTNNSYSKNWLDNTFSVFKSIDETLFLIYTNRNKSIVFYNIIEEKIINEIKNAHDNYITNFRNYLDNIHERDLLMSISADDSNIKIWNINNYECLINFKNIYNNGNLYSACFLNDNNQNYIITSNCDDSSPIKIFDFNGNKKKEINNSNDNIGFLDIYYDNKLSKTFIVTGNEGYIKSYDYIQNKVYHKYQDNDNKTKRFIDSIIFIKNEIIKMIGSCCDGNIRIWDFHSGKLLQRIKIKNCLLKGICLWNKNYLFVGCEDSEIKVIELNKGIIIKVLKGHNKFVLTIKTIIYPKYGKCLISQGDDDKIILWINKN